jgi:hypothetical protein
MSKLLATQYVVMKCRPIQGVPWNYQIIGWRCSSPSNLNRSIQIRKQATGWINIEYRNNKGRNLSLF